MDEARTQRCALVAPSWAAPLADQLGLTLLPDFSSAIDESTLDHLIVLDQSPRGEQVANRRTGVEELSRRHRAVLVVSFAADDVEYLRPYFDDYPGSGSLGFRGPDVTVAELASWLGTSGSRPAGEVPAFGVEYLRHGVRVEATTSFPGFKRVYVALDASGVVVVAGAFAQGYGPLENSWVCTHDPRHDRLGPDCYSGFSAYRFREDALAFRAPDAALASVEFSGGVLVADSPVTKSGMRGENQRIVRLEFPPVCACGARADGLLSADRDDCGYAELRSSCTPCAAGRRLWSLAQVADAAGVPVGWLVAPSS